MFGRLLVFRELGYDATTIRGIAAAAEVSTGTVSAVGDKETLLVTVFDEWIAGVHRDRRHVRAGPLSRDAAPTALLELFVPFVDHFARDPQLSRTYAAVVVSGRVDSPIFRDLRQLLLDEIEATLLRAGLAPGRAGRGAQVIYFGYLGLLLSAGADTAPTDTSSIDQFLQIIQFVIEGPDQEDHT